MERRAEPAHRRRGVDAVSDDVPGDQGDPGARQGHHVEPVAPHARVRVRGQVAAGHFHRFAAPGVVGQQVLLQDEGRGPLPGVPAPVPQGDGNGRVLQQCAQGRRCWGRVAGTTSAALGFERGW